MAIILIFQAVPGISEDAIGERQKLLSDSELALFVSFDGSIQPDQSQKPILAVSDDVDRFEPGLFGQSVLVGQEMPQKVRYPLSGEVNVKSGTFMFWLRPGWSGTDPKGQYTLLWVTMRGSDKYFAMHRSFSKEDPTALFTNLAWDNALQVSTPRYFEEGRWMHVAVTWDSVANNFTIFIDGQMAGESPWKDLSEDPDYAPVSLILGDYYRGDNADDPVRSLYDEFFVFKRALSADEIQRYHEESARNIPQ